MIRTIVFLALVAALLFSGVAIVEADQDAPPANDRTGCDQLDAYTYLCESELIDDETVELTFWSEVSNKITIYDAGVFFTGGELTEREVTLDGERRTTVTLPVETVGGGAGVGIQIGDQTYGENVERYSGSQFLPGEPSTRDVWVATGTTAAIVVVGFPASWVIVRKLRGEVRRVF